MAPPAKLPAQVHLRSGAIAIVRSMQPDEAEAVRTLLNQIIEEGSSYPQDQPLDAAGFRAYWCAGQTFAALLPDQAAHGDHLIAAFYLKPNFPGKGRHIANAGFIVHPDWRGQGLGRALGELAIAIGPTYGYQALMFNLVFASNRASLAIWQHLGFQELGRIPAAINHGNHNEEAVILYRRLDDNQSDADSCDQPND